MQILAGFVLFSLNVRVKYCIKFAYSVTLVLSNCWNGLQKLKQKSVCEPY